MAGRKMWKAAQIELEGVSEPERSKLATELIASLLNVVGAGPDEFFIVSNQYRSVDLLIFTDKPIPEGTLTVSKA